MKIKQDFHKNKKKIKSKQKDTIVLSDKFQIDSRA